MRAYDRTHLGDGKLIQSLKEHVASERTATAELLADIAELDDRRLYVPAGYPSMFEYCVRELGFSEDAAHKRIQAARAARRFPTLFDAVSTGRLHLTAVVLLGPHLSRANATELMSSASGKSKADILKLLAARYPKPDLPTMLKPLPAPGLPRSAPCLVAEPAPPPQPGTARITSGRQLVPEPVGMPQGPPARIQALAPQRFSLQTTIDEQTYDKLQYARDLLSHRVPSGDLGQIIGLALDALIAQVEKSRFASTSRSRPGAKRPRNKRTIPAHVRRQVWKRDHGRCTYISDSGKRCGSRRFLEFDHVTPVARGSRATVGATRLRCRAHSQYEAERAFGAGFMHSKRRSRAGDLRGPV